MGASRLDGSRAEPRILISSDDRSRSASPARRGRGKSQTVRLIRDISPSTALRAFYDGALALGNSDDSRLTLDLSGCTFAEKDLGIRVAQASLRLKAWCAEIEQWGWSGSFEGAAGGGQSDAGAEAADKSVEDIEAEVNRLSTGPVDEAAAPPLTMLSRERRLDAMAYDLEQLNYDELKDHVLHLHHARSRPASSYSDISAYNLLVMDDYTILVTHTLMQSLPHMLLLRQHLDTWAVRLVVLRTTPGFLTSLAQAQRGMKLAWQILDMPESAQEHGLNASAYSQAVSTITKVMRRKCHNLGAKLDKMLDELEGRQDKLPDRWIDDFEALELEYSEWTVKAQRSVLELEMREEQREHGGGRLLHDDMETKTAPPEQRSTTTLQAESRGLEGGLGPYNDNRKPQWTQSHIPSDEIQLEDAEQMALEALREQVASSLVRSASPDVRPLSSNEVKSLSRGRSPMGSGHATPRVVYSYADQQPTTSLSTIAPSERTETQVARPQTPEVEETRSYAQDPQTPASMISSGDSVSSPLESPSKPAGWKPRQGALNAVMAKRRNHFKENLNPKATLQYPAQPAKSRHLVTQDMEQQISSLLTALPTPIKLETRRKVSGAAGSAPRARSGATAQPLRRSRAPSLTLARAATPFPAADDDKPASSVPRVRKSAGSEEPEIQLYHLSSSKGLAPTKLYIRRVGENGERLMVRVGGGWADLADYLQQYAEHHGRRAVSGSHDTVQVLDMEGGSTTSSPVSAHPDGGEGGWASAGASRRSSAAAGLLLAGPSTASDSSPAPSNADAIANITQQSPQSVASSNGLRRSLGPGDNGASLAGPRVKKLDLSGEKQEWIDGMVERAKKANTIDLSKDRKGDAFTNIGKVGGTKRLFMKGP